MTARTTASGCASIVGLACAVVFAAVALGVTLGALGVWG